MAVILQLLTRLSPGFTACLLLLLSAASVRADEDIIGLYADEDATRCDAIVELNTPILVYIRLVLDSSTTVTGAEFRIENYPGDPGSHLGFCTMHPPLGALTIGEPDIGYSIALDVPSSGPIVDLGHVEIFAFNSNWIQDDYAMRVVETLDSAKLIYADDAFAEVPAEGGRFTFNCQNPQGCPCGANVSQNTHWGSFKSLY